MSDSTRRGFLKYAGAGAAVAGAAAVIPGGTADAAAKPADVKLPKGANGPMVAHIHDVRTGEMTVMVEGHEVTVTDSQLAAKIAHALHDNNSR